MILVTLHRILLGLNKIYTKKKIINGFVQKPARLYDLVKEVDTQIHYYEM